VIQVRLDQLLKTHGKSQYWLAKHARMTPQAIANLSKSKTQRIDFATLDAICKALGCQPGDLLVHISEEAEEAKQ
jgi:putative transcriptional regulator